jgi:hypothetical membrane protein
LLAAGLCFFLFNTIAEGLYPDYSVASNALSDLGAIGATTEYLWNGQIFVTGLLGLLGMYLLFFKSSWGTGVVRRRNLVGVLYLLPGIGTIVVSLFPENSVPVVHAIGALVSFVTGGLSAVYAYRLTEAPFRYFSAVLGLICLVSLPVFLTSNSADFGLTERLVVYPFVLWFVGFGSYLMALKIEY